VGLLLMLTADLELLLAHHRHLFNHLHWRVNTGSVRALMSSFFDIPLLELRLDNVPILVIQVLLLKHVVFAAKPRITIR